MVYKERCTVCADERLVDFDILEWTDIGDCTSCQRETRWELIPDSPQAAAEEAKELSHLDEDTLYTPAPPTSDPRPEYSSLPETKETDAKPTEHAWVPKSDWGDLFHILEDEDQLISYLRDRPKMSLVELKTAFQHPEKVYRITVEYKLSNVEWKNREQECMRVAMGLSLMKNLRWRVDDAGVKGHLGSVGDDPELVRAVCAIRWTHVISQSLHPMTSEELRLACQMLEEGQSIVDISDKLGRPPYHVLRNALRHLDAIGDGAVELDVWRLPERFLKRTEFQRQVMEAATVDTAGCPEKVWEMQERRQLTEKVIAEWLESKGIRLILRSQLPTSIPRPFALLRDGLTINGGAVLWLEIFEFYGLAGSAVMEAADHRLRHLERTYGPGCVLFPNGHSPDIGANWGTFIAVDPRELDDALKEVIHKVQTSPLGTLREELKYSLPKVMGHAEVEHYFAPPESVGPVSKPVPRSGKAEEQTPSAGPAGGVQPPPEKKARKGSRGQLMEAKWSYRPSFEHIDVEAERVRKAKLGDYVPLNSSR